jgi:hypothetical protein
MVLWQEPEGSNACGPAAVYFVEMLLRMLKQAAGKSDLNPIQVRAYVGARRATPATASIAPSFASSFASSIAPSFALASGQMLRGRGWPALEPSLPPLLSLSRLSLMGPQVVSEVLRTFKVKQQQYLMMRPALSKRLLELADAFQQTKEAEATAP